jgi:hypothetical protein
MSSSLSQLSSGDSISKYIYSFILNELQKTKGYLGTVSSPLPEKKACLQDGKTADVGRRQAMCPISTQSTLRASARSGGCWVLSAGRSPPSLAPSPIARAAPHPQPPYESCS